MLKVNDIPEQVIRDIAGAYHRRLESTGTEAQDEKERDFQRACYLRTALEWLALWLNQQAAPAAQVAQVVADDVVRNDARYRFLRDCVSNMDSPQSLVLDELMGQIDEMVGMEYSDALDAAIDEALLAAQQQKDAP